jgi:hypothetical protein
MTPPAAGTPPGAVCAAEEETAEVAVEAAVEVAVEGVLGVVDAVVMGPCSGNHDPVT